MLLPTLKYSCHHYWFLWQWSLIHSSLEKICLSGPLSRAINFVHLRNVRKESFGGFVESDHLDGDVDMFEVINALLKERSRRIAEEPGNHGIRDLK